MLLLCKPAKIVSGSNGPGQKFPGACQGVPGDARIPLLQGQHPECQLDAGIVRHLFTQLPVYPVGLRHATQMEVQAGLVLPGMNGTRVAAAEGSDLLQGCLCLPLKTEGFRQIDGGFLPARPQGQCPVEFGGGSVRLPLEHVQSAQGKMCRRILRMVEDKAVKEAPGISRVAMRAEQLGKLLGDPGVLRETGGRRLEEPDGLLVLAAGQKQRSFIACRIGIFRIRKVPALCPRQGCPQIPKARGGTCGRGKELGLWHQGKDFLPGGNGQPRNAGLTRKLGYQQIVQVSPGQEGAGGTGPQGEADHQAQYQARRQPPKRLCHSCLCLPCNGRHDTASGSGLQSCSPSVRMPPNHRRPAGTVCAIFCFGLNHHSAPIEVREKVAFAPEQLEPAYRDLLARDLAREALIVSTCNRTEIYTFAGNGPQEKRMRQWLCAFHDVDPGQIEGHDFSCHDGEAVQHLFRVVCGLDSMIIGEPQILGQVKDAYQIAADSSSTGPVLNRLLHWAFRVAKRVRTETAIGSAPVSVAYAAVSLAREILGGLQDRSILLVGAGETMELVATHLREHEVGGFLVANRSPERARALAEKFSGSAHGLEDIPRLLSGADLLVSCTASSQPILPEEMVRQSLADRQGGNLMLLDLAVPRDIDPEAGRLPGCHLYTLDDLSDIAQAGIRARREAAAEAEEIIHQEVSDFQHWRDSLEVIPAIRRLRERVEAARLAELRRFRHYLDQGQDPQAVLDAFSKALMNKMLHDPISTLRQPCQEATSESLVASLDILFHLSAAEG